MNRVSHFFLFPLLEYWLIIFQALRLTPDRCEPVKEPQAEYNRPDIYKRSGFLFDFLNVHLNPPFNCGSLIKFSWQFQESKLILIPESEIFFEENSMASKDGKIFDTMVYIGLGVNGLTATYLLLMYFEII